MRECRRGGRHDDNWNGPSWPFETSKMLTGYANLLNDFPPAVAQAGNVSVENFALWLTRYVYQHTRGVFTPLHLHLPI